MWSRPLAGKRLLFRVRSGVKVYYLSARLHYIQIYWAIYFSATDWGHWNGALMIICVYCRRCRFHKARNVFRKHKEPWSKEFARLKKKTPCITSAFRSRTVNTILVRLAFLGLWWFPRLSALCVHSYRITLPIATVECEATPLSAVVKPG